MPGKNHCIDENLLLWKGMPFSSNTSPKHNTMEIKLLLLCDYETRYILHFFIYTVNENAAPDVVKN